MYSKCIIDGCVNLKYIVAEQGNVLPFVYRPIFKVVQELKKTPPFPGVSFAGFLEACPAAVWGE